MYSQCETAQTIARYGFLAADPGSIPGNEVFDQNGDECFVVFVNRNMISGGEKLFYHSENAVINAETSDAALESAGFVSHYHGGGDTSYWMVSQANWLAFLEAAYAIA